MRAVLGMICCFGILCNAGCEGVAGFVVRESHVDHGYRRKIRGDFRRAFEDRQERRRPAPPAFPAPEGLDRG